MDISVQHDSDSDRCADVYTHYLDWDMHTNGDPVVDDFFGDEDTPSYSHCVLPSGHEYPYHRSEDGDEWDSAYGYRFGLLDPETGICRVDWDDSK